MPFTAEETSLCNGIQEAQIKSWNAIVFPEKVVDAILNANVLEKDVFDHGLHISLQRAIKFANELPQFRTHSTCDQFTLLALNAEFLNVIITSAYFGANRDELTKSVLHGYKAENLRAKSFQKMKLIQPLLTMDR